MDGVRDHEGAVVAHEEDVLVPQHLAKPLPLLDHGGGLVTRVIGAPVKKPATIVFSIRCQCQGVRCHNYIFYNVKISKVHTCAARGVLLCNRRNWQQNCNKLLHLKFAKLEVLLVL